jgi:DNA-binding LacI/PurR family transcriptional regulator
MATIADVCKEAGVSKATVSRVLNNTGQVTEETKERVFAAIDKLGYRPNSLARALATNKTNTIGLIVPAYEGSHYGTLLMQATLSCELAGKQLFVTDGRNDPEREREAIMMLKDRRCDAIILYSRHLPEETILELSRTINIPLVTLNRKFNNPDLPCITFDQFGAGYTITKYLLTQGHRDIACITGLMNTITGSERYAGYKKALEEFGVPLNSDLVEPGNYHYFGGYEAFHAIKRRQVPFTAVVACSDEMAIGVEKALTESGIRIPEEVSVVGIDDSRMASYAQVPLTTIHIPNKEMMSSAIDTALKMIEQKDYVHGSTRFVGEIVERNSVMPLEKKTLFNLI